MEQSLYLSEIRLKGQPGEAYLTRIPAVRHLMETGRIAFQKPVTFLVGENGAGKSTLLEAIAVACGFNPEGGTRNMHFSTVAGAHSSLHENLLAVRRRYPKDGYFLRAESFFNVASHIDGLDEEPAFSPPVIDSYGGVSLHKKSHGESFLALVQNRFGGRGLYLLDEPEAALSPMRMMTLISEMHRLVQADSQFVIATHSPILMLYPDADVLELSEEGVRRVQARDTEHYRVTRRFLENPKSVFEALLGE